MRSTASDSSPISSRVNRFSGGESMLRTAERPVLLDPDRAHRSGPRLGSITGRLPGSRLWFCSGRAPPRPGRGRAKILTRHRYTGTPRLLAVSIGMPRFIEADSDRRTFIKRGLLAGGSLALAGAGVPTAAQARRPRRVRRKTGAAQRAPNILVILVDQLRAPAWVPASLALDALLPNLASLRRESVSFEGHYTASNDCSPSRGALLTGLYSHQTGCMITGRSKLSPGFPTWGTLLRDTGLRDDVVGEVAPEPAREGVATSPMASPEGPIPHPTAAPGQGTEVDPTIVDQFEDWFDQQAGSEPWCTTVSLVNPHDVAWWYRFTSEIPPGERTAAVGQPDPAQLRDSRRAAGARQAAAAPLAAGDRRPLVRRRAVLRSRNGRGVERPDEHVPAPADLRRPPDRPRAREARGPAAGERQHGDPVHLRPRRVRRLARHARQGRLRLRGGDPRSPLRERSGAASRPPPRVCPAASSPPASTSSRCC